MKYMKYFSNKIPPALCLISISKFLYVIGLFIAWTLLKSDFLPVPFVLFFQLLFASGIMWLIQKPWEIKNKFTKKQYLRIIISALMMLVSLFFFFNGLKNLCPVCIIILLFYDNIYRKKGTENMKYHPGIFIISSFILLLFPHGMNENSSSLFWRCLYIFFILISILFDILQQRTMKELVKEYKPPHIMTFTITTSCIISLPLAFISFIIWGVDSVGFFQIISIGPIIVVFILLFPFFTFNYVQNAHIDMKQSKSIGNIVLLITLFVSCLFFSESFSGLLLITFIIILTFFGVFSLNFLSESTVQLILPISIFGNNVDSSNNFNQKTIKSQLMNVYHHIMSESSTKKIFIFLSINFTFMFVELIYGLFTNSLGLISDAGHMFFDCTALVIALYAAYVVKLKPNKNFSYGYGRFEVVSGFFNGVLLLFVAYFVFVKAIERVISPPTIHTHNLILVSLIGLIVNLVGVFFFHDTTTSHDHSHNKDKQQKSKGWHTVFGSNNNSNCHNEKHNYNIEGVYLHILADALGSVGVLISSICVHHLNWIIMDALASIMICVLIVLSVYPLIKNSALTLLQCSPPHLQGALKDCIRSIVCMDGVLGYRSLHFWSFTPEILVMSLNLQIADGTDEQRLLLAVSSLLKGPSLGVTHLTIQLEKEDFISSLDVETRTQTQPRDVPSLLAPTDSHNIGMVDPSVTPKIYHSQSTTFSTPATLNYSYINNSNSLTNTDILP